MDSVQSIIELHGIDLQDISSTIALYSLQETSCSTDVNIPARTENLSGPATRPAGQRIRTSRERSRLAPTRANAT